MKWMVSMSLLEEAPSTEAFVDISGEHFPTPRYHTTAKMLWDDHYLYIYAEMEEPHIWANLQKRDTIVFYDNDFEVFIDPVGEGHNYFEIETNARGTSLIWLWRNLIALPVVHLSSSNGIARD
nr:CAZy families CBM9 protein [uncultured Bacteroides sp.]